MMNECPSSPAHYQVFLRCERCEHDTAIECADVIDSLHMYELGWMQKAFKYLWRWNNKDTPMINLKKARWCIERAISVLGRKEKDDVGKLTCDNCWFGRFGKCENSSVSAFGTTEGRVHGCSGFASLKKAKAKWDEEKG